MARTDEDTWDLATGVGATAATAVAAARALATRAGLIEDPSPSRWSPRSGWSVSSRFSRAGRVTPRSGADGPGDGRAHEVLRRFFVESGRDGIRQAVILASGLDARGYRLPWPTGTVVYGSTSGRAGLQGHNAARAGRRAHRRGTRRRRRPSPGLAGVAAGGRVRH